MPITYFPDPVQTFTYFIPGSYTAGLFRNFMMRGALEAISTGLSPVFAEGLRTEFSLTFDFFGAEVGVDAMFIVLACVAVLFAGLNVLAAFLRGRRKG